MAHPPKIAKLCLDLQCYIRMHCRPGDKLPAERVLCKIMGVSSRTLGTAMRRLVDERLIIRNTRGSFVSGGADQAPAADEPLTLLLPCPDFSFNEDTTSALSNQQMIRGALAAAKKYRRRVITIPVTDSNNPDDINPTQLARIDAGSMVMFQSRWYEPLFPFFRERRCRLAFLNCGWDTPEMFPDNDCYLVTERNYQAALFEQGIAWLSDAGAGRILFAVNAGMPEEETDLTKFEDALKRHGVKGKLLFWSRNWNFRQCTEWLKHLHAEEKFDGLVLYSDPLGYYDPELDFYEMTGLPTSLPLLISESGLVNQPRIGRHAAVIHTQWGRYSREAAEFLLSGRRGKEFVTMEYKIEPASQYQGIGFR